MDTDLMGNWLYTWVCSAAESPCDLKNDKALDTSLEGSSQTQQINGQTLSDATTYFVNILISYLALLLPAYQQPHGRHIALSQRGTWIQLFYHIKLMEIFFFSRHAAPHLKRNP
jgi:hypothetical protein